RDARITSIYEGTTQLQVVAAIRGVTTGGYIKQIRAYENEEIKPELHTYRRILISMTEEYEDAVEKVTSQGDNEYIDFHARRMVEMAGNIVMGYLLLLDTNRDHSYWKSLEVFLKIARGENKEKAERIRFSNLNDLGKFKQD
ncbi:MAG: acyl-CoA dehydrogenase, partial [Bacteroidales bacterium]|nr:acyl-CoA dehydrogenase [Bacteroidales bacterium]